MDILGIVVRIAITYVFLLIILRLAGKRTIREGTPFDLLVALVLGDFPDDVIWGEVPVAQGIVAIGSIMTLHILVTYASYRSIRFDRLLGAAPTVVLRNGRMNRDGLRRVRMNEGDVDVELRRAGQPNAAAIAEANVEPTGDMSIRLTENMRPARRRDLGEVPRR
jgi:uncharacterized membrane protein YcaP (DUF421 family)